MMQEAIKNFPKQFDYEPEVENAGVLKKHDRFIVAGMGGSHLAADLLKVWDPFINLRVHEDYNLPELYEAELRESLVIVSSYSGNTEEALDAFSDGLKRGLNLAVLTTGGKLLKEAKENKVPHIVLPDTGIQPRSALGFALRALLKLMGKEDALRETSILSRELDASVLEDGGKSLAGKLKGTVPIIYSSRANKAIAQNWKIKLNETGKIPAFYNVFPELNHNEMTGFSAEGGSAELNSAGTFDGAASGGDVNPASLARVFAFIFLRDEGDYPKITKRMDITKRLYEARKLPVYNAPLAEGAVNKFEKIFSSLLLADWTSYYTALEYGVEPEQVPMVEEFKRLIA